MGKYGFRIDHDIMDDPSRPKFNECMAFLGDEATCRAECGDE